jgi:hypothetical protein
VIKFFLLIFRASSGKNYIILDQIRRSDETLEFKDIQQSVSVEFCMAILSPSLRNCNLGKNSGFLHALFQVILIVRPHNFSSTSARQNVPYYP